MLNVVLRKSFSEVLCCMYAVDFCLLYIIKISTVLAFYFYVSSMNLVCVIILFAIHNATGA